MTDLVNGDHFGGSSSGYPAVAGYPNVTVPAGAVHGLPVGVSFFGRAWSEPTLIRIAYAFEQATQARLGGAGPARSALPPDHRVTLRRTHDGRRVRHRTPAPAVPVRCYWPPSAAARSSARAPPSIASIE